MLEWFDHTIITFLNQFSQMSPWMDKFTLYIAYNDLVKGGVVMAFYWWFWFQKGHEKENRPTLAISLLSAFVVMFTARAATIFLPMVQRPLWNPGINFLPPVGVAEHYKYGWSSFPSDHAGLFFALCFGIFLVSKRAGILLFVYTSIIVMLPRLYLGFHWPTDIMAGAFLGIGICWLLNIIPAIKNTISYWLLKWENAHPQSFYTFTFLLSYQMIRLFHEVRQIGIEFYDLIVYT